MNSGPWSGVAPLQHEDRTKRGFLRVTASIGVGTLVSLIAPVASNAAETTGPEAALAPRPSVFSCASKATLGPSGRFKRSAHVTRSRASSEERNPGEA